MYTACVTHSQAQTSMLNTQSTLSSSQPPDSSPSSSDNVNALFNCETLALMLSPVLSQMADDQHHEQPPHLTLDTPLPSDVNTPPPDEALPPPQPPVMDLQLQNTMTTLIEAMTCQFQAQAPFLASQPCHQRH